MIGGQSYLNGSVEWVIFLFSVFSGNSSNCWAYSTRSSLGLS